MPPELRPRKSKDRTPSSAPRTSEVLSNTDTVPEDPVTVDAKPPIYIIDLSLPPSQRYVHVARDFKSTIGELTQLFDEVLDTIKPRIVPRCFCHFLAWVFLQRLFHREQTEELKGMSRVLDLPMYLLVAYNVFLDLLMGCTSGGVLVKENGPARGRMMHFRTLDWGMPALRKAIVQYNFVESPDGKVIATTIGYVGFVGVLTGVKKDLSVSLNFRPYHNHSGLTLGNFQYYWHLLLVLLGFRPSISAQLRDFILPVALPIEQKKQPYNDSRISPQLSPQPLLKPSDISSTLPGTPTTAAYLIFSTSQETLILEKDLRTATTWHSSSFITTTNHDKSYEETTNNKSEYTAHSETKQRFLGIGMQDLIDESVERKACLTKKWEAHLRRQRCRSEDTIVGIRAQDLKRWMLEYPVCNEDTHFVCVMDPGGGEVRWVRRFEEGEIGGESAEI